ncbi:hypothetical protein C8A05DRAFT_30880 [Staphylotrichum tortipilum]|uniref:Uncharacterized protein n=1 Tax=Staphylotrichum tortipilum TaxID=2831512 RepID=A0AAN6RVT2_9PEZI|nr:hypothetical protein C8A05DRAFT_30880 [Staphylotrichum longicolle]
MRPKAVIVVRGPGAFTPGMAASPARRLRCSKGRDRLVLRQGLDIALEYFNTDDIMAVSTLTSKARIWADRYFKGYRYAAKRPTALLQTFPDLFNLDVEPHLRLERSVMSPPSAPEPEGASSRELRRAERKAMNTEAFPEFAEPTLASDAEIDEIVHLRAGAGAPATKPKMRVDAAMLRGSGFLSTLPEFLGQLARANLETETMLANNPDAVRFELDEDQAASQQHVEMNLFSDLPGTRRHRRQGDILLPGDFAVQHPGASSEHGRDERSTDSEEGSGGDSGDETDASTSTAGSRHANLKKRKSDLLEEDSDSEEQARPANKIRLHRHYPPEKLRHFDMKRGKLITRPNPVAAPNDPFAALAAKPSKTPTKNTAPAAPSTPSSWRSNNWSSSPPSSSKDPVMITRIRVSSRSPDGSRSSSPDKIIMLRHPVLSRPYREGSRAASPSPASSGELSSSGSGGSNSRKSPKIKVVLRGRPGEGRKVLVEEVE